MSSAVLPDVAAADDAKPESASVVDHGGLLRSTFRHLPGIGPKREHNLWREGILTWDDLDAQVQRQLTLWGRNDLDAHLDASRHALSRCDGAFFADRLPRAEHWRIAATFPKRTLFVDIETTGLSRFYDDVTLIGWAISSEYGVCLPWHSTTAFVDAVREAAVVVTFNGSLFDLPFLRDLLPGVDLPRGHVDLRFVARRVGVTGGQKDIEQALGISRAHEIASLDGGSAPDLWHRYQRGNRQALDLLVRYNYFDITGMFAILDHAFEELVDRLDPPGPIRGCLPSIASPNGLLPTAHALPRVVERIPPYGGHVGPRVQLADLPPPIRPFHRIVGIDLSGSEIRPSGFARLAGGRVSTSILHTDDEILRQVLDASPDLVSIDAPLSLPRGRTSVGDDDPGRAEFGITRECERVLKQRGVNVYPCLIRSMQRLTERGIRLAQELRVAGVPVIESFPGAMQDVLGIPRKRESLMWLNQGLREFGLEGPFDQEGLSHDELDAISSAVVGLLLWVGYFEALGNDDEDYLIIPAVEQAHDRVVVGLSGGTAVGKTTVASALRDHGFEHLAFRDALGTVLNAAGEPVDRDALRDLGTQTHFEGRQRWLADQVVAAMDSTGHYVIDGFRFPEDHTTLVERLGGSFVHVHLEAAPDVRRGRFAERRDRIQFENAERALTERAREDTAALVHHRLRTDRPLDEVVGELLAITAPVSGTPKNAVTPHRYR